MLAKMVTLVAICTIGALAYAGDDKAATTLPADHPIYKSVEIAVIRQEDPILFSAGSKPTVTFEMSKREYSIAEPIEGALRISNPRNGVRIVLAPPYRGVLVDTIAVWAAREIMDESGKITWSEVAPVMRLNQGQEVKSVPALFSGKPIVLEPGQDVSWKILVNVGQPSMKRDRPPTWLPCVGFAEEGNYRVYVKYVNVAGSKEVSEGPSEKIEKQTNITGFPMTPVVLGPYEIVIKARDGDASSAIVAVCHDCGKDYRAGKLREGTVPMLDDEQISQAVDAAAKESDSSAIASLRLAGIRNKLQQKVSEETLKKLLKQYQTTGKEISDGRVKDAYALTECYVLYGLGKKKEAIDLAKKLKTPDAIVLVELWERDKSQVSSTKPQAEPKP